MDLKELIKSALTALRRNIMRTSLTMLGIIIGISAVILIVSIGNGAVAFITEELSVFGTNYFSINPGTSSFSSFAGGVKNLTLEDADAIREDSSLVHVTSVAPVSIATVKVSANEINKSLVIQGVTHDVEDLLKPTMLFGEFINEEHDLESQRVVVMGKTTVETFFGEGTDPVGEKIKVDNKTFEVIGVAQSASLLAAGFLDNSLYIPLSVSLDEIEGQVDIGEIDVSVDDPDFLNETIEDVKLLLRDRHDLGENDEDDFTIQSSQDAIGTVQTITSMLTLMIAGISAISLVVGGVGVMNIMLVSVTERTKEIGLLKAIGARDKDILNQFLIESIVMTLIGGIIGIAIGILGAFGISIAVGIPFVINITAIVIAVGVSMLVGIVFGLYPARRAARLSPIDALRYE